MVSFEVTAEESKLIAEIATRAFALLGGNVLTWEMDITVLHANHCPLRLGDLLSSRDGDFIHDCDGISANLDRDTGKLGGHFLPRFAV